MDRLQVRRNPSTEGVPFGRDGATERTGRPTRTGSPTGGAWALVATERVGLAFHGWVVQQQQQQQQQREEWVCGWLWDVRA